MHIDLMRTLFVASGNGIVSYQTPFWYKKVMDMVWIIYAGKYMIRKIWPGGVFRKKLYKHIIFVLSEVNKMGKYYELPKLEYDYRDLMPYMSEEQLKVHHTKHHQAYVNGANAILKRLEDARKTDSEIDVRGVLKELSFQIGGHLMHTLFWENLTPAGNATSKPEGGLLESILNEFGTFERFKKEFTLAATTVEGSGWGALTYCLQTERPIIMQVEKHNVNVYPMFRILMVMDVFEHAYYIDYKNDRAKFIENLWKIINWERVSKRFDRIVK